MIIKLWVSWLFVATALVFNVNARETDKNELPALYTIPVDSLSKREKTTLAEYYGKPLLLTFFSKNCPWCEKQHAVLKEITSVCPNIQPILLGFGRKKQPLKHILRRLKNEFPAYLAPNDLVNTLGSQVTPRVLIVTEEGQFTHNIVGYMPSEKLLKIGHFEQFQCAFDADRNRV